MTRFGQQLTPPTAVASGNGHGPPGLGSALPTRHHPKGYMAVAVALIVACSALGYWFYAQAGAKAPVVAAVSDIPVGHTITRADLTTVDVAGGVTAVAGNHLSSLVGQTAAVEILPHTLVQRAMVTAGPQLGAGQAVVGVALAPGQLPSAGLRPGERVEVLGLPQKGTTGAGSTTPSVLATSAIVFDVGVNPSSAGGTLASLQVGTAAAGPIAAASNAGLVALVQVGG